MKEKVKDFIHKYKIFGRTKGRKSISNLDEGILNKYILHPSFETNKHNVILDIGSGNGENTLYLAKKYPDKVIIASDRYVDGNINLCNQLNIENIENVKIFNKNILLFFEKIAFDNFIDEVWILFPDPWPKTKHQKRRLIDGKFLKTMSLLLKKKAKIFIATDSISYFISILINFHKNSLFKWINDKPYKWDYSKVNLTETKYYKKAKRNKQKTLILIFEKI